MTARTWARIALGYLALVAIQIGVWAQFAPRSFYDDFPGLGRTWVSVDGPYNEHLVRDVGGLYLALSVLVVAAMITLSRTVIIAASVAVLVSGVPHFVYHVTNRDGLSSGDLAMSLGGLALFAALPVALLAVGDIDRAGADAAPD
jgi:hypothetical protein